ncbi:MAG: hypothetical protein UR63_C0044G0004 [Candidatus Roizmanbacteria bacterium GW2011_GWC2_35_12]|nr:MAG: hypothetical protein UR63_C0044G0004 [Candidatus Roizmanbacteria bacterium GW2011_GWC2_35_12]
MVGKIFDYFRKRPGLLILSVILLLITVVNIKPDFYLMGWDNYSSYFNLKTNIFRTFFATWREYRGLGVPSDAEVTDIFRQIFYWLAHFIFPEQLLDQVYYMVALWVGILGMYAFTNLLWREIGKENNKADFFATFSAFFYLFNLNTLSVFYALIIPFINRFYSLPLTLFLFLRFLKSKHKVRDFFILAFTIIITSGTYITPTLIITSLVAFFIFLWTYLDLKKAIVYCFIFLSFNAFWILPFINYTFNKSSIIPLARTFVEINEATLNQSSTAFSFDKQVTLRPSFFNMAYSSLNGQEFSIHPMLNDYKKPLNKLIIFIFPALFISGTLLILFEKNKEKKLLWIPTWILLFLFLSLKEYSPLGFLYVWMKHYIPYFDIVFRISDTKFHSYIAFAGSITAAYVLLWLFGLFNKIKLKTALLIILTVIITGYSWLFRSYVTGDLIGFFVYTKIPKAYFEIAKIINDDPEDSRVLHLPMDNWQNYWRSYSWGYFGSAFFHYLIDKPYIDKTFEPGSMENSYLDSKIGKILDSFYQATSTEQKQLQAENFLSLIKKVGIKYLIVDQSISTDIYTRNMNYNARQTTVRVIEMMQYLRQNPDINYLGNYPISLSELYPDYKKLYPVKKTGFSANLPIETSIDLYTVNAIRKPISFVKNATNVDPYIDNLLETDINLGSSTVIQEKNNPSILYPFKQQNHQLTRDGNEVILSYKNSNTDSLTYQIKTSNDKGPYLIDIYGKVEKSTLSFDFYHRYYPNINGNQFQQYLGSEQFELPNPIDSSVDSAFIASNWTYNTTQQISSTYRIKLNDIFIPIPINISNENTYITSYLVDGKNINISLFEKSAELLLPNNSLTSTNPPSCYGTKSNCVSAPIIFPKNLDNSDGYLEVEMQIKGSAEKGSTPPDTQSLSKQVLNSEGTTPISGYICIQQGENSGCLNLHRNLKIFPDLTSYLVPLQSSISDQQSATVVIGSVPVENYQQTMNVENIKEIFYSKLEEKNLDFNPFFPDQTVVISGPLSISFPKFLSNYSYIHKPDFESFNLSQEKCRGGDDRTVIYIENILFNDVQNCDSYFYLNFNYAYQRPYVFTTDYFLGSGQSPFIVLGKNGDNLFLERVSLYQGYPNLFSKQFQDQGLFSGLDSIKEKLTNSQMITASRLFDPTTITDTYSKDMNIHIFQTTENEGLMALGSINMIDYPSSWNEMSLTSENFGTNYQQISEDNVSYKKILPSLWKVKANFPQPGDYLLFFNQGYDRQWRLSNGQEPLKCDGYANCFAIHYDGQSNPKKEFYIFYTPETLYLLGWILTLFNLAVFVRSRKKF